MIDTDEERQGIFRSGQDTATTLDTSASFGDLEANEEDDNIIHDKQDDVVTNSTEVGRSINKIFR